MLSNNRNMQHPSIKRKVLMEGERRNKIMKVDNYNVTNLRTSYPMVPEIFLQEEAQSMDMVAGNEEEISMIVEDLQNQNDYYRNNRITVKSYDPVNYGFHDHTFKIYQSVSCFNTNSRRSCRKEIESIKIIDNSATLREYEKCKEDLQCHGHRMGKMQGRSSGGKEVLLFHGTSHESLTGIVSSNFKMEAVPFNRSSIPQDQMRRKLNLYGKGIYLSQIPEVSLNYGDALIVCKVLLGESIKTTSSSKTSRYDIPAGFHSKIIDDGKIIVIKKVCQILPYSIIILKGKNRNPSCGNNMINQQLVKGPQQLKHLSSWHHNPLLQRRSFASFRFQKPQSFNTYHQFYHLSPTLYRKDGNRKRNHEGFMLRDRKWRWCQVPL